MESKTFIKHRRHVRIAIAFCVVLAFLLASIVCAGVFLLNDKNLSFDMIENEITSDGSLSQNQKAQYSPYYKQSVNWTSCGGSSNSLSNVFEGDGNANFECATIKAPLDWSKSADEILPDFKVSDYGFDSESNASITLHLTRLGAKSENGSEKPYLFTNPGGPGASGVSFLQKSYNRFPFTLLDKFAVASWDPRGVGLSDAINCFNDDKAKADYFFIDSAGDMPDASDETDDAFDEVDAVNGQFADSCKRRTGELLKHVDTQSSARDLELIRAVVTAKKLNYLGFSYGTTLGSVYAGMFSNQTDRFVLDGAAPANISLNETAILQAGGFQTALNSYLQECIDGKATTTLLSVGGESRTIACPFAGKTVEYANSWIKASFDRLKLSSLSSKNSTQILNGTTFFYGVAAALYSKSSWPYLTLALSQLKDSKIDTFIFLANSYFDYDQSKGTFSSNMPEANIVINCLDDATQFNLEEDKENEKKVMEASPTLGEAFSYGDVVCQSFPKAADQIDYDVSAPDSSDIVVIGTLRDPATPYSEAEQLAKTLQKSILLTYDSDGHTAFLEDDGRLSRDVVAYFVDGKTLENGKKYKPGE